MEVKGTQAADPLFFMSDGEREFPIRNASKYQFFVVAGIDLQQKTHVEVHRRHGAIADTAASMKASQCKGRLYQI